MNTNLSSERGFFHGTVGRPVALMVCFATLIVLGLIAYERIQVQLLPSSWQEPAIRMWIPNPGSSAEENEEQVARTIEEQLRTLTGIQEVRSWSFEDGAQLNVSFDSSLDLDLTKAEIRDRIERARPQLPDTVEEISMWSEDADQLPITFFGILLRGEPSRRDHLMDKIVIPRLEAVQGIGNVEVWGVLQDSIRVLLDEDKVAAAQLDLGAIIRRLMADNFALPMGEVNDGGREIILRSDMRFQSVEEVGEFPIGGGLKLKDVGRVARVKSVRDFVSRIDGAYAYYGMATKDSQSNVVETSNNFKAAIAELEQEPSLAGDFEVLTFFLQGEMIESALSQLQQTAMWGGALAVVVLFVFLRRVRLTLCVALSIPVSALMAIVWEYFAGGSFNLLTMTGITLGIGMLVDNAVVVVENIARVNVEEQDGKRSAVLGARQIALAVTLATLTTVVVFMPLIFMTENPLVGVLFGGIGIPLSISLVASLLVAVVFLPVIAGRILTERHPWVEKLAAVVAPVAALPTRLVAALVGAARFVLHYLVVVVQRINRVALLVLSPLRWILVAGVAALAYFQWQKVAPGFETGKSLEPFGVLGGDADEQVRLGLAMTLGISVVGTVLLALLGLPRWRRRSSLSPSKPNRFIPGGTSLIEMLVDLNQRVVGWTLRHRLLASFLALLSLGTVAIPMSMMDVAPFGEESSEGSVRFRAYFDTDFTLSEADQETILYEEYLESKREEFGFDHWANNFSESSAQFSLYWDKPLSIEESLALYEVIREDVPRVPGHRLRFYDENESNQRSNAVVPFTLMGPDSDELERLGLQAVKILETVPGLSQISTPLEKSPDEIEVVIDRDKAHGLGVDTNAVQETISYVLRGFPLPRYQEDGRDIPFVIEFDEEKTAGLPTLRDMSVFGNGAMVPLATFANLNFTKGSRQIYRKNGQTSFTIEAKVDDPLLVPVTEQAYLALAQLELPRGYSWDRGESALSRQEEEFGEFGKALALSIVLVFLVMGILFESVMLPFSVLVTIPFAIVGALWTLFLSGRAMDFMGWIGMIILAGVVVNNGIVLIDRIHTLRPDHPRSRAVVLGCGQRVRPVLMTALTTVCGLLPMMLSAPPPNGIDYRALATIVAGGLIASTFFTLWVVPLAYTLIDDLTTHMGQRLRWAIFGFGQGRRASRAGEGSVGQLPSVP